MAFLLHHLLQASARSTPDAPAFRCQDRDLSYARLDRLSDSLAGCLLARGLRRGDRVGIYLNKSLECAIAVYGILKAGAVYVPLDPGAPAARLAALLQDCGLRCLVTHDPRAAGVAELLGLLPSAPPLVIGLSKSPAPGVQCIDWDEVAAQALAPPDESGRAADDAAYIIYTSGSTGAPKGIVHSHGSGLSYAQMAAELYGLTPEDRLSNLPPLHFDQSIFDFFSGVAAGACTVIIPEAYARLPASLSELIQRERLTIWYSVPYALIQLLLHGVPERRDLSSLRHVLFGGEPFPGKYLARLMELWPRARFCNVYGPAEVNQCTYHFVDGAEAGNPSGPPIGRACPNVELLVVDDADRPVAPGKAGELLIRTPTMMRGYFGQPQRSAEAVYCRRNDDGTEDRFYRSGDLVREDEHGRLHFLGRSDRQVKLRGFRIELDEIESLLTAHPAVEEAASVLSGNGTGEAGLRALVTLNGMLGCDARELRRYLAERLPPYAVPEQITILASFPRTTTGKIDRNRLGKGDLEPAAGQGQDR